VMYLEGSSPPWAGDTIRYVRDGVLPEDDSVAEWVAPREKMFRLIDGDLYRRSGGGVLLRCISQDEGNALL
jgi:hypothetical protein